MAILLLKDKATPPELRQMLEIYSEMIKVVVDVRQKKLAGGGEMHADCESALLEQGSEQDDLWGANWYPQEQRIEYESLINIRPRLGNRSIILQAESLRLIVEQVTQLVLAGVPDEESGSN